MTGDRATGPLAAVATLLAAYSLDTVVADSSWLPPALLGILVVTGVGLVMRSLTSSVWAVAGAQVLAAVAAITFSFARPEAILWFVPGPGAWRRLSELWADGGDTIQSYTAPAPALRGLLLIIAVGIVAVAVCVDVLAASLRLAAVAGLPLLALYCVPAAVVTGGLGWGYFAAAATGWLLLVAHEARHRVGGWGRVLPRWTGSGPAPAGEEASALAAAARRLGATAVAVGVLLPALLPGLPENLLAHGGGGAGTGLGDLSVVNPVLALRDNLNRRKDTEVLRYRTDQQDVAPLRIVTSDRFDGQSWSPSTGAVSRGQRAQRGLPPPPGLTSAVQRRELQMTVEIRDLDQDFLPLPYPTRRVDVDGDWLYDARSLNVVGDGETTRGRTYTVDYLQVVPTSAQLQQAGQVPSDIRDQYTALPASTPEVIAQTARKVTSRATSQYERAVALQQWFRDTGGFVYSTQAPASSGTSAVVDFLRQRQGYCVQFSSAMAVMARTLGIPARIAVGFLPGSPLGDGWWSVRLTDAHAWPELYFQGVGWVRFEPTPSTRAGAAPPWAQSAADAVPVGVADGADTGANPRAQGRLDNKQQQLEDRETKSQPVPSAALPDAAGQQRVLVALPWRWVGLVILLVGALCLTPVTAWWARRRRRRAATSDAAISEAAWADLAEQLGDLGVLLPVGSTPRQVDADVARETGLEGSSRGALHRVAQLVEDARYAPAVPSAGAVHEDVRTVVRAVAASRSRGERWRALLVPRSGAARLRRARDVAGGRLAGLDRSVAGHGRRLVIPVRDAVRRRDRAED